MGFVTFKRKTNMNRVYRLLWNNALGMWIPVSELSKSAGKKSSKISSLICPTLILTGISLFPLNVMAYSVAGADVCADTNNKIGIGQDGS